MGDAHADVGKHMRLYIAVFGALAVFTLVTVAASTVDFGGSMNIIIALIIATIKASLVAAIFMHLKWEKSPSIWWMLALCAVFLAALVILPVLTAQNLPAGARVGMWG